MTGDRCIPVGSPAAARIVARTDSPATLRQDVDPAVIPVGESEDARGVLLVITIVDQQRFVGERAEAHVDQMTPQSDATSSAR